MKKTITVALFATLSLLVGQSMAADAKAPAGEQPAAEHEHKSCCPVMKDKMKKMHEGHDMKDMDHSKMHEGHDMKGMDHSKMHEGHDMKGMDHSKMHEGHTTPAEGKKM